MYTVYKVTNIINHKYYIGVHKTNDPNDDYMGSGPAIKAAISKYGIDFFKKDILFIFEDEIKAYNKEKELLENCWSLPECYNMTEGGIGSWSHVNSSGSNNCMKRKEIVEKVVATTRENGSYYTPSRIKACAENAKLGSLTRKGMKDDDDVKHKRNESVKRALANPSIKSKMIEKIRQNKCVPYLLISPDGVEYYTEVVSELCEELNIPLSTVTTHADGRRIKRGKLKGWTITKKGGNN